MTAQQMTFRYGRIDLVDGVYVWGGDYSTDDSRGRGQHASVIHPPGEANLTSVEMRSLTSNRGERWGVQYVFHVTVELIDYTEADLKERIQELELGYSVNNKSCGLFHTDGTSSAHVLWNEHPQALSGVKVDYMSFPRSEPDEYATVRTGYIRLSATYWYPDHHILYYRENLEAVGTGEPRWRWAVGWNPSDLSPVPFQQQISPWTTQKVVQSGVAVGLREWPEDIRPGPLFAEYEHKELRRLTRTSPRYWGQGETEFGLQWRYVMELPPGSGAAAPIVVNMPNNILFSQWPVTWPLTQ